MMGADRPTPETDAAKVFANGRIDKYWIEVDFARRIESERDEARELLRQAHNEYIAVSHDRNANDDMIRQRLQTIRDEAFGMAPDETTGQNIESIESGITALLIENQALRAGVNALHDALRVRINYSHCPECDRYLSPSEAGFHAETCRHYAIERKVME